MEKLTKRAPGGDSNRCRAVFFSHSFFENQIVQPSRKNLPVIHYLFPAFSCITFSARARRMYSCSGLSAVFAIAVNSRCSAGGIASGNFLIFSSGGIRSAKLRFAAGSGRTGCSGLFPPHRYCVFCAGENWSSFFHRFSFPVFCQMP